MSEKGFSEIRFYRGARDDKRSFRNIVTEISIKENGRRMQDEIGQQISNGIFIDF